MAPGRVLRCWVRGHTFVRERDADGVWTFTCSTCRYRTPIVARTADERDAMARRFPRADGRTPVGRG